MSYCRWSSDSFDCDIYAFAHVQGTYEVWVASNRVKNTPENPKPTVPDYPLYGTKEKIDEFWNKYEELSQWMETAIHEPIGLPCDGEQFSLSTALEAAEKMEELKAMGYNVPQYAIDALKEEAKHEEATHAGDTGSSENVS